MSDATPGRGARGPLSIAVAVALAVAALRAQGAPTSPVPAHSAFPTTVAAQAAPPSPGAAPAEPAEPLAPCLDGLKPAAVRAGIDAATWDVHLAGRVVDPGVLEALDAQPEFRLPIWDYLAGLVDAERIADGKRLAVEHAELLQRVEAAYGVEAATVVAVWGVESDFGRITGKRELLTSLATLSCHGRRQAFFRGELFALLRLVQRGDVDAANLTGSWAGAFGQTQFMPSTYQRLAQDFDGDGRRDLVASVPDALASTANFLKRAGWRSGEPWGAEVRLPAGFNASLAGRTARRPLAFWQSQGLTRIDGGALEGLPETAALLLPAGADGPAWLVFRNFNAIYGYNAAESYALAISLLSDAVAGRPPMQARWPTDDPGTSRAERRELQAMLLARGHAIGEADGLIGALSREAIKAEEARLGWAQTGRAGQRLLQALRDQTPRDETPRG